MIKWRQSGWIEDRVAWGLAQTKDENKALCKSTGQMDL